MTLGQNIRQYRELRGMTQAQLADAVGISQPTVSAIELGERDVFVGRLPLYAAALGVEVSTLMKGVDVNEDSGACDAA